MTYLKNRRGGRVPLESLQKSFAELKEAKTLLKEAQEFMNLVPNNKYGDNYKICAKISKFLK